MAITKLHYKQRMQCLVKFLRALPRQDFYFGSFVSGYDDENSCGTVCCAIGWMPKIDPKHWKWREYNVPSCGGTTSFESHEEYFGITTVEYDALFIAGHQEDIQIGLAGLAKCASPNQVADNLEKFIAWKWA